MLSHNGPSAFAPVTPAMPILGGMMPSTASIGNDQLCTVCGAEADGLHYNAISCRSCNAFFRRAVTFKQTYLCRKNGNCDINQFGRCACRACRFNKCLAAGMKPSAVQPRRDPTGSQKNRRPPKRKKYCLVKSESGTDDRELSSGFGNYQMPSSIKREAPQSIESSFSTDQESVSSVATPLSNLQSLAASAAPVFPAPSIANGGTVPPGGHQSQLQQHQQQQQQQQQRASSVLTNDSPTLSSIDLMNDDDGEDFEQLIYAYGEHTKLMNRAMTSVDQFLKQMSGPTKFRKMVPSDVDQLSTVELSGLLYWIEKQHPFRHLSFADREILLKRYSVRKLSLDHFYTASKFGDMIAEGKFVMLNNTYVPPEETGFEGVNDDPRTRKAKQDIFRPTIDRLWATIVVPFWKMRINDAEIVTLHSLLLWSGQNNRYVSEPVKAIMQKRREWTVSRLFEHYIQIGHPDPVVRLGEVLLFLPEIELVCDLHCTDFQVAKLFQFCDSLSSYWYDKWCYSSELTGVSPTANGKNSSVSPGTSSSSSSSTSQHPQPPQTKTVETATM